MQSMFPTISMSELQRNAKAAISRVQDYAVVQSHGQDRALLLNPELGRILLESGMLAVLKEQREKRLKGIDPKDAEVTQELGTLIGNVLKELSKK